MSQVNPTHIVKSFDLVVIAVRFDRMRAILKQQE